ncbi:hypothetical protein [Aeromicrobium phragmitis]|uniref:hypothetical protein n=1 Tax=Aeromicrobium phragmitis TaxID=2478914 RepID=UPI00105C6FBA|nr:hypothetical protein [Aeromicrobium phragmitis]
MSDEPIILPNGISLPPGGTYLIRPERFDTSDWPPQRALALHIGEVLLAASELDAALTRLIGVLLNPEKPNLALARGRFVIDKIRMLETVYPDWWHDSARFTRALKRVTGDRNSLAHALWGPDLEALRTGGSEGPAKIPLLLHREKSTEGTPVDFAALHQIRVDIGLLSSICHDLVLHWASGQLEKIVSIVDYVQGWASDALYVGWPKSEEWQRDVKRVFPSSN